MKVFLATDHAGFELKEKIVSFLKDLGYETEDKGAFSFNKEDDYPDFISQAASEISKNPQDKAIIFGGSGQGEAITSNRFSNVRCAVYYGGDLEIVRLSREHNNANILSLGARFLSENEAKEAVKLWLNTSFSEEERHQRRIEKIEKND